jgi:sugar phosphate isomerase/epimerase
VDGIELIHTALRPVDAVSRIHALIEKHGLPVIGMSYDAQMWDRTHHSEILEDAQSVIERLAQLGGRTMGTSVGYKKTQKTPEDLDAQAELLRKLIAICDKNKVVLNLHNHVYEVRDGEYDLKGTLARIPDARLGPDIGWLTRTEIDPVDFIRRHAKNMIFAHLRDQGADGKWSEAMGEGRVDYRSIGGALHQIGFHGDLSIELAHDRGFQPTRPIRESLKISREYVRKVMGY